MVLGSEETKVCSQSFLTTVNFNREKGLVITEHHFKIEAIAITTSKRTGNMNKVFNLSKILTVIEPLKTKLAMSYFHI